MATYIDRVMDGFRADPPDSDFQDGCLSMADIMRREGRYNELVAALSEIVAAVEAYEKNHGRCPTKRLHNAARVGRFELEQVSA
jgi:hypothetical protein